MNIQKNKLRAERAIFILVFTMVIGVLPACTHYSIAEKAGSDYCECYDKYSDIFQFDEVLITNKCIDSLGGLYPFIKITYEIYSDPTIAGKKYTYKELDSILIIMREMRKYVAENCESVPSI